MGAFDTPFPTFDKHDCAGEIVSKARAALKREREIQAEYIRDLLEQLEIARLMHNEAANAEAALARLEDGDLFVGNSEILANPGSLEPPTPSIPTPIEAVRAKIVEALAEMVRNHAHGELTADAVAEWLGEPVARVRTALHNLSHDGLIQYVQRHDKNQLVVLPLGETLQTPDLSPKQQSVLDALDVMSGGADEVTASMKAIQLASGATGVGVAVDGLEKKGRVEVLDRGDSKRPAKYRIKRAEQTKAVSPDDRALIEAALAQGKVTKCPPAFAAQTTAQVSA